MYANIDQFDFVSLSLPATLNFVEKSSIPYRIHAMCFKIINICFWSLFLYGKVKKCMWNFTLIYHTVNNQKELVFVRKFIGDSWIRGIYLHHI